MGWKTSRPPWSTRADHGRRLREGLDPRLAGHDVDTAGLTFKSDDALKAAIHAETTDKIMVASPPAASTRCQRTSCRAAAAMANR